jgi:hypothetical protein
MKDQLIAQRDSLLSAKDDNERYQQRIIVEQQQTTAKLSTGNSALRIGIGLVITAFIYELIRR